MIEKQPSLNRGKALVTFRLDPSIWADQVTLIAQFDGLNLTAFPMRTSSADPGWHVTLELDTGQCYLFAYLIDGRQWSTDFSADGHELDALGRQWSVVLALPQGSDVGQEVGSASMDMAREPDGRWKRAPLLASV
jgi:hypothetical protein